MGEKREVQMTETVGPGAYNHERADSLTKTTVVNIKMGNEPRDTSLESKTESSNIGPAAYDEGKKFG